MNSIIDSLIQLKSDNRDDSIDIFSLNDHLNSLIAPKKYYQYLFNWLNKTFKIHTFKIQTIHIENDIKTIVFHKGKEFDEKNKENLFHYSYALYSYMRYDLYISADNNEHMELLNEQKKILDLLLYLIQPSLRSMIIQNDFEEVANIDHVTGLHNRKYLIDYLQHFLPLAQREKKQIGFIMIGIDHFKAVIDEFNYDIGDKILIQLAKTIKKNIRTSDLVVRLESDEFLIVLANINASDDAINVSKKLIKEFSLCEVNVNSYTGQTLKKTICAGATIYPDDTTSVDQLLKNADIALYEARNKGRSQVLAYSKEDESTIDLF